MGTLHESCLLHPAQVVRKEFMAPISTAGLWGIEVQSGKHVPARGLGDRLAYGAVKGLRAIADVVFYHRYVHRAIVLETVAAIPGMVGGMVRHFRSLRNMKEDAHIRTLLAEAENERMHLLTWMEVSRPWLIERVMVMALQGIFFNAYLGLYLLSPKTAHRFVGYLEEEAIISYSEMVDEIEKGIIPNTKAPSIAKRYWNLPDSANLLDVTLAIRADEAAHRDVNHELADSLAEDTGLE
ncbi:ubiquinol oxidase [Nematocida homosporus]|uniref:ubiquinol oxidase n=1 Tax=Nematocida homosporus TaxID=1912981 RepID=UPI00222079B5|nr:ubiquinol oxidase [Nematocida homosporus]KAI5187546.1 ubiquinol oxidase [Nematocida homosporus]